MDGLAASRAGRTTPSQLTRGCGTTPLYSALPPHQDTNPPRVWPFLTNPVHELGFQRLRRTEISETMATSRLRRNGPFPRKGSSKHKTACGGMPFESHFVESGFHRPCDGAERVYVRGNPPASGGNGCHNPWLRAPRVALPPSKGRFKPDFAAGGRFSIVDRIALKPRGEPSRDEENLLRPCPRPSAGTPAA